MEFGKDKDSLQDYWDMHLPNAETRLSEKIWKFKWKDYLPCKLEPSAIEVTLGSVEQVNKFMSAHFREIYTLENQGSHFISEGYDPNKVQFYKQAMDIFLFWSEGKLVGLFMGNPLDWSTYYLRNVSILPEFQGKKIFPGFLDWLLSVLTEVGVSRCDADVAPSNLPNIHILNKFKFNITGMTLQDRWGALVRFTKYLKSENVSVFLDQFCFGKRFQF